MLCTLQALMEARSKKSPQELQGKYSELLNNLLSNTAYTR